MTRLRYALIALSGLILAGSAIGAATLNPYPAHPVAPAVIDHHTDQACDALYRLGDPAGAAYDLDTRTTLDDRDADTVIRHVLDNDTCNTH